MHDGWPQSALNQTSNALPEPWIEFRNFLQTWDRHISKLSRASIYSEINIQVNFCPKNSWILYVKRLVGSEKTKNFYIWNCFKNVNVMANTIAWTRLLKSHFFLYFFCFLLSTTTNSNLIGQHWFADCFSQSNLNFGSVEFSRQENVNKQIPFISEFMNTWWIQQHICNCNWTRRNSILLMEVLEKFVLWPVQ